MTLSLTPAPAPATDQPDTREVLARLIEYALVEARREGETGTASHLYQALDALTRVPEVIEWPHEMAAGPRLAS